MVLASVLRERERDRESYSESSRGAENAVEQWARGRDEPAFPDTTKQLVPFDIWTLGLLKLMTVSSSLNRLTSSMPTSKGRGEDEDLGEKSARATAASCTWNDSHTKAL